MIYTGVGSRETPEDVLQQMRDLSVYLDEKGYALRSGGAVGADQAFEHGASGPFIYTADGYIPEWTNVFTDFFHPAPERLKPFARRLMNRNAMQVLGAEGNVKSDFLVCWTKGGGYVGGTAQAIRIAEYYNIPVYNLAIEGRLEKLYANY